MEIQADQVFTLNRYGAGGFSSHLPPTLPGSVQHIAPTIDRALIFAHAQADFAESEFEIRLALREAMANAVVHGCKCDSSKQVHCLLACHDGDLLMIVRNPGAGFDPEKVPSPTGENRLLKGHGRGLQMMRHLLDELRFERGGTHMIKRSNESRSMSIAPE